MMSVASSNGSLRVGDIVNVPGNMHGTVKFIGQVDGKKGTFAGVQLAPEYATRGKNSGDVDGKSYFKTTSPGSGIFLPVEKAEKRSSTGSTASSTRSSGLRVASTASPTTPTSSSLSSFTHGGRTSGISGLQKPNFSQTIGPGSLRASTSSPTALKPPLRRESLPRPTSPQRARPSSPLRKVNNASAVQTPGAGRLQTPRTRPSLGLKNNLGQSVGSGMKSPGSRVTSSVNGGQNKFSQSLRQSTSHTPGRLKLPGARASNLEPSPLGPDDRFDEDDNILEGNEADTTPTPVGGRNVDRASASEWVQESQRLREQLDERDQQLAEQAASIAEMERSLTELQKLIPQVMESQDRGHGALSIDDDEELPRDVQLLRDALREKNERIRALTAEFDSNRADFRSTIDTLEMASTETERVYEARVEDLLHQVQQLQDRSEDVEGVAMQFRQLEELVQELEEGLEESRRAEAEARSEVEFLRGEVERGKSELRRERERHAAQVALEGSGSAGNANEDMEEMHAVLDQKENEIRGLKAIIQGLQGVSTRTSGREFPISPRLNGSKSWGHSKQESSDSTGGDSIMQKQIRDLEMLLDQKKSREDELREEVRELRKSMNLGKWSMPHGSTGGIVGLGHRKTESEIEKHASGGSQRTITGQSPGKSQGQGHQRKDSGVPGFKGYDEPEGKDQFGIDSSNSEATNNERQQKETDLNANKRNAKLPSDSGNSYGSSPSGPQWCEICEESGHDLLNCVNMMSGGSSQKVNKAEEDEQRNGKDVVREGLRRSTGSGKSSFPTRQDSLRNEPSVDRPAPLRKSSTHSSIVGPLSPFPSGPPPPPPTGPLPLTPARKDFGSVNAPGNDNRSRPSSSGVTVSTSVASTTLPAVSTPPSSMGITHTTTTIGKPTIVEGSGDQAGMVGGKSSGVIDPDKWCALCEKDGHDSVDCPIEDGF